MADLSTHSKPAVPGNLTNRVLLSSLTRWWSPAETSPSVDSELGYESALPWTLRDTQDGRVDD